MIFVTRAIIIQNGSILAAQRPASMSLPFKWELPGGKVEEGETDEDCLIRETMEELSLEITVLDALDSVYRTFNGKNYRMLPYLAVVEKGTMQVNEHEQAIWCRVEDIFELDWAPAELQLLKAWIEGENAIAKVAQFSSPNVEKEVVLTQAI